MKSVFNLINRDSAKGKYYFIQSCLWIFTIAWVIGGVLAFYYFTEMNFVTELMVSVTLGALVPDFSTLFESYSSYREKKKQEEKQEELDRKNTKVWFPNHKQ